MADQAKSKIDAAAEQAYAEAAAKETKTETAAAPKAKAKPAAKKKVAKAPVKKAAPKKVVAKKRAAPKKKVAAKKAAPKKTAKVAAKKTAASTNPITKAKDTVMATAKKAQNTDFTKAAKEAFADAQTRAKTAFAKTGELASEVTEFNKGNVEAVVESGKIFFAGMQDMGRDQFAATKTVVETVQDDFKKVAAVKSPTEFMQLQGELARRNFDAAVSFGSKNTEALVKLYNEAFAPISSRVSVAAEKIKKAA
ncbi:phasin family protein [Altererythrobacter sp.]|uniref:phasin family protein n=1 Tax=Altererythrobacter sp. TaxID=1872480 RepID=UPI001B1CF0A3|nr:phasin family protein [Altererythrobacter sp.]MBO6610164.1 phasin family protein [Altererythrobacter sp.]MBO6642765.1 phasin family protein [Altererythrobacter sp.]MBO6708727.1 phasin family protein [Altererythrobacter sp.]